MDNPETVSTLSTQDTGQINVREEEIKNGHSGDTDNMGHTRHRTNKC